RLRLMAATARGSLSTNTASPAPRDSASIPSAPEPAKRSSTRSPSSGPRIEKSASRTRSAGGRVLVPRGTCRRRPLKSPATTLTELESTNGQQRVQRDKPEDLERARSNLGRAPRGDQLAGRGGARLDDGTARAERRRDGARHRLRERRDV